MNAVLTVAIIWSVVAVPVALLLGRYLSRCAVLREMDAEERCADGCGRVATHGRFEGITDDGTPILMLVCHRHAGDGSSR